MTRYVLSPRAQADIDDIWDYTAERWNEDQAQHYIEDIRRAVETIARDPRRGGRVIKSDRGIAGQLMNELPQERLIVATHAMAMMERALELTIAYVKERVAFGKKIIEFQNTQFVLAECKTEATIAKVFLDHCIGLHLDGELDTATASMAKYRLTDLLGALVDRCLQLFGGYGYMDEYPISRLFRDARVMRIYAGTNEIMKLLIARGL